MKHYLIFAFIFLTVFANAQVKIGDNPNTINAASILELESASSGLLITRMTTAQRDAISSPPAGLQIYNTTTNTLDVYRNNQWESTAYNNPNDNLVYVYSVEDLPDPASGAITLDANSMYIFKGIVDISPNYLELNGASLRGIDPQRDGLASSVSGAILRSTDVSVFMQNFVAMPLGGSTVAYDFSDGTGTKYCNLFSGNSVIGGEVGQISGFQAVTILQNYWNCGDGLKLSGTIGKFTCGFTFITGISAGAGLEFLGPLVADDIDLSNNYFIYSGQTGIKLNSGAQVNRGRMTTNMFRDVGTILDGLTPHDIGWQMSQNTNIQNTRTYGYLYMNENSSSTSTSPDNTYVKISGSTTSTKLLKFESNTDNRLTYKGVEDIVAKIFITVNCQSPANDAEYTLAIAKNGVVVNNPNQSSISTNNQAFTLVLETEADMSTDDYIEPFIKTTSNDLTLIVTDLQFRVRD